MRAIREMYKRSGGTDYRNLCAECDNFFRENRRFCCRLYQEAGGTRQWQPQWIACRYFNLPYLPEQNRGKTEQNRGKAEQRQGEPEREETGQISEQQEGVQMSIFDYPEYLSGRERT